MSSLRRAVVAFFVLVAVGFAVAGPAQAQERPNGPTAGDFINEDGEFDTEGYLAAFTEFQSAPSVARGGSLQLNVFQCTPGTTVTAEVLGFPDTSVSGTAPDGDAPAVLAIEIPDEAETGFNRIRVTCGDLLKDVVINVVSPDNAGAVQEIDVYMIAAPEAVPPAVGPTAGPGAAPGTTGTLPVTGSEVRNLVGGGMALIMLGAALAVGVRQRLRTTA